MPSLVSYRQLTRLTVIAPYIGRSQGTFSEVISGTQFNYKRLQSLLINENIYSLGGKVQNSDLAHFLEERKTF